MLKIIQAGNALPISYPVDTSSTFQPGQVGQLKLVGQDIVVGLSDGTSPLGILDDIRTQAFTQSIVDEIVIIPGLEITTDGYNFFNGRDSMQRLDNPNIIERSFLADYSDLILTPINGLLTLPAGCRLNWDADGDGQEDSVKTIVNYVYQVSSLPGDDTTIGSNRATIWFQRGIFSTDQFDTTARYSLNSTLFVNEYGQFTTTQPSPDHPGVAMVVGPPTALYGSLELLWL